MRFYFAGIRPRLSTIWEGFLDLVFPRVCIGCGRSPGAGPLKFICPQCRMGLHYIDPPYCRDCGYPYFGRVDSGRTCPNCVQLEPRFSAGRSLILHRGIGARIVIDLKYHNGLFLRDDIRWIAGRAQLDTYLADATLIPVPLHSRKLRERGFNQSAFLAEIFASTVKGARVSDILVRAADTSTQTRLSRDDRRRNVKNAFAIRAGITLSRGMNCVLVDDVYTTGATLNECARVLLKAGANDVRILTLAHG